MVLLFAFALLLAYDNYKISSVREKFHEIRYNMPETDLTVILGEPIDKTFFTDGSKSINYYYGSSFMMSEGYNVILDSSKKVKEFYAK